MGDYESAKRSGSDRIGAARAAMAQIAKHLPGHDIDLDAFAKQFAGPKYAGFGKSRVASAATYELVRSALRNCPELADRAVAMRLNGLPSSDRQLIELALQRKGASGYAKYAEAERMIRDLGPFSAEERKDILGLVRAGPSFDSAVAEEKKTLGRLAAEEGAQVRRPAPALDTKRASAIRLAQADAARWKRISHHMNVAIRSVPRLSRGAEAAVGGGAALGSVGSLLWNGVKSVATGNPKHIEHAVEDVGDAGSYMAGELSQKIAQASQLFLEFSKQHIAYAEQNTRFQRAVKNGDYEAVRESAARMNTLREQMHMSVKAFDAVATKIGAMNQKFDAAAAHAAVNVLALGINTGGAIGEPALHGASHILWKAAEDSVSEAAVVDLASKIAH